jgi:general secretion pathway protein I
MHVNSRSAARGFTLLEVMAALVIVSLGMLGVIEAIGQTASNSTLMRDRTIAHWIAMNRLTEVRLETRAPNIAKTSDEVEMAGRSWRWTMEVSETPIESMRRIDIRVSEAEVEDDERTIASVTGFYGSAIAAAGMMPPPWSGVIPGGPGAPGDPSAPQDDPGGTDDEPPRNDAPPNGGEQVDPPLPDRDEQEGQE